MSDSDNPDNPGEVEEGTEEKESQSHVVLLESDDESRVDQNGVDPIEDDVKRVESDGTKMKDEEDKVKDMEVNEEEVMSQSEEEGKEEEERVVRRKVVVAWQCLNPECTVGRREELVTADSYTSSYYGLRQEEGRKRKVCLGCREEVERGRRRLLGRLERGEDVLAERLPVPRDMVVLEDSDEEPATDSSRDSDLQLDVSTDSEAEAGLTAEQKLASIIDDALASLGMGEHIVQATRTLGERMDGMKEGFDETEQLFKDLEVEVDGLRKELYAGHTAAIQELPSVDLTDEGRAGSGGAFPRPAAPRESAPPPAGGDKAALVQGQMAYAMRQNILQVWRKGRVEALLPGGRPGEVLYKLRFEGQCGGKRSVQTKVLSPRHLAYTTASKATLAVGTRCIGLYRENSAQLGAFYSGVIAEPPKTINSNRYLVFFDDGYASYIAHEDVRVVCRASTKVWEDVHENSREFIQQYLQQYPERPMVKLVHKQVVKTEWDGKWWITHVDQIDASLVKLVFETDGRTEWIYRGSTRLGPLFMELEQQRRRKEQAGGAPGSHGRRQTLPSKRRDAPYVEYRREEEPAVRPLDGDGAPAVGGRMVARKSATAARKTDLAPSNRWEQEGSTEAVEHPAAPRRAFRPHTCSPACLADPQYQFVEAEHKQFNLLLVPVLLGWDRQIAKKRGSRKILYVAPCGRRLRSFEEVHRYLRTTDSTMEIDFFSFDWWLHVRNEFKPSREFCTIKDLSYGKEHVMVSCVNSIDRNYPEYVEYSTVRLPQKNVTINTAGGFLNCCDCTDDCSDKDRCACWQMTIQGTACDVEGKVDRSAGYNYRRLNEIVLTGIFECNSKCACKKTCLNRVVQHPLRMKLQVFKTEKRGWGIRTLHDIPQGSFICVYVGNLFESEEANKQGQNFGDEYFAELDMIEVVERRKDGYESDVSDLSGMSEGEAEPDTEKEKTSKDKTKAASTEEDEQTEEEAESEPGNQSPDSDFTPSLMDLHSAAEDERRARRRRPLPQVDGAGSDSDGLEVVKEKVKVVKEAVRRGGFSATTGIQGPKGKARGAEKAKFVSTRKLYGKGEDVYIMDAKSIGNIGRYLNHSCNPNVFVQNVFVDTHDMRWVVWVAVTLARFPWIAFFSSSFVRAGGELCWDYNYEVRDTTGRATT